MLAHREVGVDVNAAQKKIFEQQMVQQIENLVGRIYKEEPYIVEHDTGNKKYE